MTPEGKVKAKIKELLKSYGSDVYYFMPAMGTFGKNGVPDIVACVCGAFLAIEVKADKRGNPPTAIQEKNLNDIKRAEGHALVIDANDLAFLQGYIDGVIRSRKDTQALVADAVGRFL